MAAEELVEGEQENPMSFVDLASNPTPLNEPVPAQSILPSMHNTMHSHPVHHTNSAVFYSEAVRLKNLVSPKSQLLRSVKIIIILKIDNHSFLFVFSNYTMDLEVSVEL